MTVGAAANPGVPTGTTPGPSNQLQIKGNNATDPSFTTGASFTCYVAASAGTFTIPASVLPAGPPRNFGGMEVQATPTYATFSAGGLNLAFIQMSYGLPLFTTFQ